MASTAELCCARADLIHADSRLLPSSGAERTASHIYAFALVCVCYRVQAAIMYIFGNVFDRNNFVFCAGQARQKLIMTEHKCKDSENVKKI